MAGGGAPAARAEGGGAGASGLRSWGALGTGMVSWWQAGLGHLDHEAVWHGGLKSSVGPRLLQTFRGVTFQPAGCPVLCLSPWQTGSLQLALPGMAQWYCACALHREAVLSAGRRKTSAWRSGLLVSFQGE